MEGRPATRRQRERDRRRSSSHPAGSFLLVLWRLFPAAAQLVTATHAVQGEWPASHRGAGSFSLSASDWVVLFMRSNYSTRPPRRPSRLTVPSSAPPVYTTPMLRRSASHRLLHVLPAGLRPRPTFTPTRLTRYPHRDPAVPRRRRRRPAARRRPPPTSGGRPTPPAGTFRMGDIKRPRARFRQNHRGSDFDARTRSGAGRRPARAVRPLSPKRLEILYRSQGHTHGVQDFPIAPGSPRAPSSSRWSRRNPSRRRYPSNLRVCIPARGCSSRSAHASSSEEF